MPLVAAILLLAIGVLLLYGGAEVLVRGASRLAGRLGMSSLLVGLTVVAFGTSAPELVVSIQAALAQQGGIAVGNVVGSNIANIGLILGLCVVIRRLDVHPQLLRVDIPVAVGATVLASGLLLNGSLSRTEGVVLLVVLLVYLGWRIHDARRSTLDVDAAESTRATGSLVGDVVLVVTGLFLLVIGAESLVRGGTELAESLGVPPMVIGLTVIAVGTSLPELATTTVAAIRGEGALAVGNVVGSNLFNLLCILGVAAVVRPLEAPALRAADLGIMLGAMVLLLPFALSRGRLSRVEGAILITGYVMYVAFVVAR